MRAVPVVISLLVLLDGVLGSTFSGILYYNLSWVRNPEELVQQNKTAQVQTDVCSQITSLVPWYGAQENSSTCTIDIGEQKTNVNYTILATDEFIRTYDPLCVTYDILLANQVRLSPAFRDKYYLIYMMLENRNRTQPVSPCKLDVQLELFIFIVRTQFTRFLNLNPNNGSHINTEQRKIYEEPMDKTLTGMAAQITFNNSMLAANGINYTCPPFKQLVKASLDSPFFYSNSSYLWKSVNILEEKSDGRSADTTTASSAPDQTSTNNDSVITVRTTTRGDGAGIHYCLASVITTVFTSSILPTILRSL
ncbi:hypothetical protein PHET_07816 [Paragonimus heterotremus]|uniref:Uncharacterized protein n=1 Tax=Paragonimus heterotremus TaxID=100268 RepID=A0A8J4WVE5_9TREM|nr:hypothetical protein PHET_07816 [Paragonimus heterotremus]